MPSFDVMPDEFAGVTAIIIRDVCCNRWCHMPSFAVMRDEFMGATRYHELRAQLTHSCHMPLSPAGNDGTAGVGWHLLPEQGLYAIIHSDTK